MDMEIIGYAYEGETWCEDCATRYDDAVFDYEETDSPIHCAGCATFLGGALSEVGMKELVARWRDYHVRNVLNYWAYMARWPYYDWYFMPTFVGMLNPLTKCIKAR